MRTVLLFMACLIVSPATAFDATTGNMSCSTGIDTEAAFDLAEQTCKSKGGETPMLLVALDLVKQLDPQHNDVCTK